MHHENRNAGGLTLVDVVHAGLSSIDVPLCHGPKGQTVVPAFALAWLSALL